MPAKEAARPRRAKERVLVRYYRRGGIEAKLIYHESAGALLGQEIGLVFEGGERPTYETVGDKMVRAARGYVAASRTKAPAKRNRLMMAALSEAMALDAWAHENAAKVSFELSDGAIVALKSVDGKDLAYATIII